MERVQKILEHTLFRELYDKLYQAEKNRIFCRHTMEHFLDVARLMYIYCLEDNAEIPKEMIYAAALLHDIGRYEQISKGTPHDEASAGIGEIIMQDCGFDETEIRRIRKAILGHRTAKSLENEDRLTVYLYRADKKSRNCFSCPSRTECDWPAEKKNLRIEY